MKKTLLTILQYLLFLGLGIFFVWLTVKDIDKEQWEHIKYSVRHGRQWLLFPAMVLLFGAHYVRALRWKILMQPLGYRPGNFNTFAAVMIGYLVNAGVPRLGEVVKCTLLAKYEKVRADKLVGTIVVERAADVACLLLVIIIAVTTQSSIVSSFISSTLGNTFSNKAGHISLSRIALLVGGILIAVLALYLLLKRFAHVNAISKFRGILKNVGGGLSSIKNIDNKGAFIFQTFLLWALYIGATTIGIYSLRETAFLGIAGSLPVLVMSSIGMILTPGGIGAVAKLVEELLQRYGVATAPAIALGWLLWVVQTLVILIGGLICFALLSYFNKNKTIENSEQPAEQDTIEA